MITVIIILIAFSILIYFAYFSKNKGVPAKTAPLISDVKAETTTVGAVVKEKYVTEDGRKRKHYLRYMAIFDCDDGEEREFSLKYDVFSEIKLGERETLIYSESLFVGFGDHGATAMADGEDESLFGDEFSYDDFDAGIDIEQNIEQDSDTLFSSEDLELMEQFRKNLKLPQKTETVQDETDSPEKYPGWSLLQKSAIYPFLKRENGLNAMFDRTYREAIADLYCYDGDSRKGKAADSIVLNKNEFRVLIEIQERPSPLYYGITAEFGVNE